MKNHIPLSSLTHWK